MCSPKLFTCRVQVWLLMVTAASTRMLPHPGPARTATPPQPVTQPDPQFKLSSSTR